jgi:polyisoprenyl-phosphate glycosyltransferase
MNQVEYSVVIPVYNSSKSIEELCSRLISVFENTIKGSFEIILVNDFSTDHSWKLMCNLHEHDNRIKTVNLARNYGQHSAILCGFNLSQGKYTITLDDDLQHPPEEIPKLIKAMHDSPDSDVVCGDYESKKHSIVRNLGTKLMNLILSKTTGRNPDIKMTSFRLIKGDVVRNINQLHISNPRIGNLINYVTHNIINAKVEHDKRKYGRSGYSFGRLIKDFLLNIINNSSLPLRIVSFIGIICSIFSFLIAIYIILKYFFVGVSVEGWTSTILIMVFFFGLILLSLGIIGEYLIRILTEAKKNPNYIIKEKRT